MDEITDFTDISQLMEYISKRYTFTGDHYPALQGATAEQTLDFAIKHSALHMGKTLGKIFTECERYDHTGELDLRVIEEGIIKMLINTLKLAQELGLSGEYLGECVPKHMKSK